MFNFNLKKTAIFQAVRQGRNPIFRFSDFLKNVFFLLVILFLIIFLYGFILGGFTDKSLLRLAGGAIIFFDLSIIFWLINCFFNSKLKEPKLRVKIEEAIKSPEEYNLAEFLSFESAWAVLRAENNTSRLLYNLLSQGPRHNFIFYRAMLVPKEIKKILRQYLHYLKKIPAGKEMPLEFQETILESLKIAQKKEHKRVGMGDMLAALALNDLLFKKILIDSMLKAKDIENLVNWLESINARIEKRKKFWEWENLIKLGSIGKDWAAGYTPTLDRFSADISQFMKNKNFPKIVGHKNEILRIERILARQQDNNVLIIGEPGSGRKSLIEALAVKSSLGQSMPEVNYKRVVQLDLPSLLAQTGGSGECESILDIIFREVISAGNIILVIDDFHNFVGGITRPGVIDISGALMPYLPLSGFQIAAITTYEGLHKTIELNSSLLNLFEKVEVAGISEEETLIVLEDLALFLEYKHKKFVSYLALRDIIRYCSKYLPFAPFPEKAIRLLDEAVTHIVQQKEKILLPKHIAKVFSEKIQIPVGEIEAKEKEILLKLEELIHQRIVNQEEAVKEICAALRRARAEISARDKPMGSFLFLGPTGVGKTETSKALAEFYFGSEKKMVRLDMSEFQQVKDISRLIGSSGEEGLLTTAIRENPFSVILVDEIEKTHPNILNLFLQVLDEGFLTDGLGRKTTFRETIIIATSNAGYQLILEAIEKKSDWLEVKPKLLKELFEKGIFRPEFINRFDAVVIFKPLDKNNLIKIAELMLTKIKKGLAEKEIEFIITEPLKEKIVELGYDPKFGAREMKRVIQDKVENILALAILSGTIKKGDRIEIDANNFQISKKN
ncbi:ATP-dependent Clp protease ATP-binding subunit [Patescibacteria group bacterium]|nr:ATP-dependent Clp protease ATP-binding subunit [Patescibacteria group bacterium]